MFTDEHPDFVAHARNLANALRDTIFVDQVGIHGEVHLMHTTPSSCIPSTGDLQFGKSEGSDATSRRAHQ